MPCESMVCRLKSLFGSGLYDGGYVDSGLFPLAVYGFHPCYGNSVSSEPAIDVCDLDDCFAWHTSSAGLCIVSDSGDWGYWDLFVIVLG